MAESPSHKFGQIIGNLLEELLCPTLLAFCCERGLYLDRHGERIGVRKGKKLAWLDRYGNSHDLDFVIEKDGSADKKGRPVAFIEAAWRRYTKHSRNKAQEIQGAVLPIAEEYEWDKPFLGAVIAGVFTDGSIAQLRSVGFEVLYIPYQTVVEALASVEIDIGFDEGTPDVAYAQAVAKIEALPEDKRNHLKDRLYASNREVFDKFYSTLRQKLDRMIDRILVIPLFGDQSEFASVTDAERFVESFEEADGNGDFRKYEIEVQFSNGDHVRGAFRDKDGVQAFFRYVAS